MKLQSESKQMYFSDEMVFLDWFEILVTAHSNDSDCYLESVYITVTWLW